ncbi:MAG: aldehyde dehydrogenase family protein [Acidimicrobiia bacterium]
MTHYNDLFIGGEWVTANSSELIEVIDPSSEAVFATVPQGSALDADNAVRAARSAALEWSRCMPAERARFLQSVAVALESRREEFADTICHEMGVPRSLAHAMQVAGGIFNFSYAAKLLGRYEFETHDRGLVIREPFGVVAAITPWNYPLSQVTAKTAYALAAGCTVVLKPSEIAPVSAFLLADVIQSVGLPAGVFNLVSGTGIDVGEALVSHPAVDKISFTGSTRAGKRILELASQTIKSVSLELGGKSPNIVLDDADFSSAIPAGVAAAFVNSGQSCTALTRLLVPAARLDEVEELAVRAAESYKVGDPWAADTQIGPMVSASQRDRVRDFIIRGSAEGARLITGGSETPRGLDTGYYVRPTVFADVTSEMSIAREEIFGPVLVIQTYESEDEAVSLANESVYGLAAGVWGTADRAAQVARRLRAGMVYVNGASAVTGAPFGGYKHSGLGRENGVWGLESFLEVKAVHLPR